MLAQKSLRFFKIKKSDENYQKLLKIFNAPMLDFQMSEGFFVLGSYFYVITSKHEKYILNHFLGNYKIIVHGDFHLSLKIACELEEVTSYDFNYKYAKRFQTIPESYDNDYCIDISKNWGRHKW